MKTKFFSLIFPLFLVMKISAVTILPTTLNVGYCKYSYFQQLTVLNANYASYTWTSTTLPQSIRLDSLNGTISGLFPYTNDTSFTFTVSARLRVSPNTVTTKSYTLNVNNKVLTKDQMTYIWSRSLMPPIYGDVYSTFHNSLDTSSGGGGSLPLPPYYVDGILSNTTFSITPAFLKLNSDILVSENRVASIYGHTSASLSSDTGVVISSAGTLIVGCTGEGEIDFNASAVINVNNNLNINTDNCNLIASGLVKIQTADSLSINAPRINLYSSTVNEYGGGLTFPIIHYDTLVYFGSLLGLNASNRLDLNADVVLNMFSDSLLFTSTNGKKFKFENGDLNLNSVGKGVNIAEGVNGRMGRSVLSSGTIVVNNNKVTANSEIFLTCQIMGTITVPVGLAISARTPGVSFTILSGNLADTSTIAWEIKEPAN